MQEGKKDDEGDDYRIMPFRELLSWKMPEHLSINSTKNLGRMQSRVHAEAGSHNQIYLYKLDLVT